MLGFIKTSMTASAAEQVRSSAPEAASAVAKRGLKRAVSEAFVVAVMIVLLALGFAIRMWVYFPNGVAQ